MPRKQVQDPGSFAALLSARVGERKAAKVCAFIVAWGTVYEDRGGPPGSIEDYVAWWRCNPKVARKDQDLFRSALPGERTPTRVWRAARAQVDPLSRAATDRLGALPAETLRVTV